MSEDNTEKMLKSHLALAVQILEAIAGEIGLDLNGTKLNISSGEQSASISVGEMVAKWKEIAA